MDPTSQFFANLRKLAVTLESETARLQQAFDNRNNDPDSETEARALSTYHELHSEVRDLRGQVQKDLTQQKAWDSEVSSFIEACNVMKQRVTQDIQTIREHCENYGYKAPQDRNRPTTTKGQESDAEDMEADENKSESAGIEEGQGEAGGNQTPPKAEPPSFNDVLRTPQLSDFGLSEMQLKRSLAGAEWCSEVLKAKAAKGQQSEAKDEAADKNETKSVGAEGGGQEQAGSNHFSSPLQVELPSFTEVLRSPQLSDFGLSEVQLNRAQAGADWCSKALKVKGTKGQAAHAEDKVANKNEAKSADRGAAFGANPPSTPPKVGLLPFVEVLRTPQLSDFGLSEKQLEKALAGPEWCSEVPPMPEMSLPHPSLNTPAPPHIPTTPKCALRMDDDELQTPQMHDFGISEHTMCLNNDFTMDLLRKNIEKPPREPEDIPVPPVNSLMESLEAKGTADNMETPEPPVFCTPGIKIKQKNGHCSPPGESNGDPESPSHPENLPATPELPAFQSAYVNRLVSTKKLSAKSLPKYNEHEKETKEHTVNSLELDGPTQEFSWGTPRLRMDFQEPSTPETPDLSSVTQDICKLVSQAQLKKAATAVIQPNVKPEKVKKSAVSMSVVSESEFHSLPSYLRQMTLHNLNQAIRDINTFMAECPGEKTELQVEELRRITNVGTKTPVYLLCLTELKRLTHVGGARNTSVYKLSAHN